MEIYNIKKTKSIIFFYKFAVVGCSNGLLCKGEISVSQILKDYIRNFFRIKNCSHRNLLPVIRLFSVKS